MSRLTIKNSDGSYSQPTHTTFEKMFYKLADLEDVLEEFGIESAEELKTHLLFKENMAIWENKFALQNEIKELKSQLSKAIVPKFAIGQEVWCVYEDGYYDEIGISRGTVEDECYFGDKKPMTYYIKADTGCCYYVDELFVFPTEAEAQAKLDEIKSGVK